MSRTKDRARKAQIEFNWLTVAEVAEQLAASKAHVRTLIADGKLRAADIGRGQRPMYRIAPKELERFVAESFDRASAA